jgi:hypothetical protein
MSQIGAKASPLGKKVGLHSSKVYQDNILPNLRNSGLWLAAKLRKFLRDPGANKRLGLSAFLVIVVVMLYVLLGGINARSAKASKALKAIVSQEQLAKTQLLNGDKPTAIITVQNAQQSLQQLIDGGNSVTDLNKDLSALYPKGSQDSEDYNTLTSQLSHLLDQAENIKSVKASTVVDFSTIKNATPTHFTISGSKLIAFDSSTSSIYSYDLNTKSLTTAISKPTEIGKVMAVASNSSGLVYILTNTPAVWVYGVNSNSLNRAQVSSGAWAAGTDIAVYYGNLYILTATNVYKYVATPGGFSAGTKYLSSTAAAGAQGSTHLAVDGSILLGGGGGGLQRYMLGKLAQDLSSLPSTLTHPISVQSYSNGSDILLADGSSQQLATVAYDGTSLALTQQYRVMGLRALYQAQVSQSGKTVYLLTTKNIAAFDL